MIFFSVDLSGATIAARLTTLLELVLGRFNLFKAFFEINAAHLEAIKLISSCRQPPCFGNLAPALADGLQSLTGRVCGFLALLQLLLAGWQIDLHLLELV